jgi:NitT/TauT family transport system substrate-binding protein
VQGSESYGEPLFGIDTGIYARAGLNVEPTIFTSAGAMTTAVVGGAVDIALTDAIVLANAVNRGVPLQAIAGAGLFRAVEPTTSLCVARSSAIHTAKDLEGQSLALGTLVSLTSIAIKMWLTREGADPDRVHFLEMPFAAMPEALRRGTVGAAYVAEPQLSVDAADLRVLAVPYTTIAPVFLISLIVATRPWIAQNTRPRGRSSPRRTRRRATSTRTATPWRRSSSTTPSSTSR